MSQPNRSRILLVACDNLPPLVGGMERLNWTASKMTIHEAKDPTLYSPLKLFVPTSALFFVLGLAYYGYTYVTLHRFTNMSMLLFSAAVIVFLIGLISEQITALMYRPHS
jgi:hypothetical protein